MFHCIARQEGPLVLRALSMESADYQRHHCSSGLALEGSADLYHLPLGIHCDHRKSYPCQFGFYVDDDDS